LVLLNGVAALILLACASQLTLQIKAAGAVVDAMLLFGVGATIALASAFFAYLRSTLRLQAPERVPLRTALWWLSVLAALAGAGYFLVGLNMAGRAVLPELEKPSVTSNAKAQGEDGP
jgi:tellurite resistance protein TehA-like permease